MPLVFEYGLLRPRVNGPLVDEQIRRAHRYRNLLVEIERERRASVRAAMASHPDMVPLEAARDALRAEWKAARAAIVVQRAKARRRAESAEQRKVARELGKQLRAVSDQIKAARARVAADDTVKALLDAAEIHSRLRIKRARKAYGVYWGTYLLQEADAERARQEVMPPKFRSWTREGRVAVQLQGGISANELLTDTQLQIVPVVDTPEQTAKREAHAKACGTKLNPANRKYALARVRIGTDPVTGEPIWAEWPMKMHRPLPPGAAIKVATVARRRRNCSTFEWRLQTTLDVSVSRWLNPLLAEVSRQARWKVTAYQTANRKRVNVTDLGIHVGEPPTPEKGWKHETELLVNENTRIADLGVDFERLVADAPVQLPAIEALRACGTVGDMERLIQNLLRPAPADGVAALNLGFSQTEGGEIRSGYLVGSDSNEQEIIVPRNVIDAVQKADSIRSTRDKNLDALRVELATWKSQLAELHATYTAQVVAGDVWTRLGRYMTLAGNLPIIASKLDTVHAWRSPARFRALVYGWRKLRFEGDSVGYDMLEAWRYHDQRLEHQESGVRRKALLRRREGYRILARKWARRYRTLVYDNTKLTVFQRSPAPESEDHEIAIVKRNQRLAAGSELRQAMVNAFADSAKYSAINMTRRCSLCGHLNDWDRFSGRWHTCDGCQARWDQDANADRNLLLEHAAGHVEKQPVVRKPSRSERLRAARNAN